MEALMKRRDNQAGFSVIEVVIIIAVVALVGFLGYTAYNRFQDDKTTGDSTQTEQAATTSDATAPEINSSSDLDEAQKVLDESATSDASDADAKQLDGELSSF
jgi:Tfp pilus assembly protein PilV